MLTICRLSDHELAIETGCYNKEWNCTLVHRDVSFSLDCSRGCFRGGIFQTCVFTTTNVKAFLDWVVTESLLATKNNKKLIFIYVKITQVTPLIYHFSFGFFYPPSAGFFFKGYYCHLQSPPWGPEPLRDGKAWIVWLFSEQGEARPERTTWVVKVEWPVRVKKGTGWKGNRVEHVVNTAGKPVVISPMDTHIHTPTDW